MNEANISKLVKSKHYRVRKEIVWCSLVGLFALGTYQVWDWWAHLNWPPHDATYPDKIKALNCPTDGRYTLTRAQVPNLSKATINSGSIDRRIFFEFPQCVAGLYLAFEGSGMRQTAYVYDVEKKRRTATIVTTFDKYEGE